jgi:hypothetical protein
MADLFEIRVECEVEALHNPESRNAFEQWCRQRMATECAENDVKFDPDLMLSRRLDRDREGPGRNMQPFLLLHPNLPRRRGFWKRLFRR